MGTFLNVSNHKSKDWSPCQLKKAEDHGPVIDIPFPDVDPLWDDERLDAAVEKCFSIITSYDSPVAMIQGEFVFSFRLVTKLKNAGVKVVAACSKRVSEEHRAPDGSTVKTSKFEFEAFREY